MHKLLERQLRRFYADVDQAPADWHAFLDAVDAAYGQSEHDRHLLERSLELTSQELLARNEALRDRLVQTERTAEEQLRQSQKMEAIGLLAGGVAHDFNNLLTVVLAYCDLLLEQTRLGDPRRGALEEIRRAGERAADLTRQLLAFGRRQVLQPRILRLNDVIENLQKMLRRLLGEDIEFATGLAGDVHSVRADAGQLEQVLVNLAVNARDAMPQGGRLLIETRNVVLGEEYARRHPTIAPGPYVLCAVSDTGSGMDAQTLERIFEPFFTTKEPGRGTGLGLSTAYGIVQQSGGFIWVYSELGHGTTFKVYLPALANAEPLRQATPEVPRPLPGHESVLLLEDEGALRAVAREVLEGNGYRVIEVARGDEALRKLADPAVEIDLLLSDIVLPGSSGTAVGREAVRLRPGLRVLYMSGYTKDAIIRHGELPPGIMFLEKPFTPVALVTKVRAVLDQAERREHAQG